MDLEIGNLHARQFKVILIYIPKYRNVFVMPWHSKYKTYSKSQSDLLLTFRVSGHVNVFPVLGAFHFDCGGGTRLFYSNNTTEAMMRHAQNWRSCEFSFKIIMYTSCRTCKSSLQTQKDPSLQFVVTWGKNLTSWKLWTCAKRMEE